MGKELQQKSADEGREPGGTAEAVAAQGGDPAIAAFIGGGSGGSDDLAPVNSPSQASSSPALDAEVLSTATPTTAADQPISTADSDSATIAQGTGDDRFWQCALEDPISHGT